MMLVAGVIVSIVFFVVVIPLITKTHSHPPGMRALSNSKQIHLLMLEFDQDFGEFPSDKTAASDEYLELYHGPYSNDYLGQLIAGGYLKSEQIFYARHGSSKSDLGGQAVRGAPDNDYTSREQTLAAGECGFAYIKGLSTRAHPETPLLLAPMYGDGYKFNTDAYREKALVLTVNGSATLLELDKNREAKLRNGTGLFGAGQWTVWGEKGFDSANLCYAKYPYHFVPSPKKVDIAKWIICGLGLLVLVAAVFFYWLRKSRVKSAE